MVGGTLLRSLQALHTTYTNIDRHSDLCYATCIYAYIVVKLTLYKMWRTCGNVSKLKKVHKQKIFTFFICKQQKCRFEKKSTKNKIRMIDIKQWTCFWSPEFKGTKKWTIFGFVVVDVWSDGFSSDRIGFDLPIGNVSPFLFLYELLRLVFVFSNKFLYESVCNVTTNAIRCLQHYVTNMHVARVVCLCFTSAVNPI